MFSVCFDSFYFNIQFSMNECFESRPLKTEQSKDEMCISVIFLRKEVIQPHLPIRLPCYDFTPIIYPTLGGWLQKGYLTDFGCYKLSWCDGRCVQGPGTYSPRHSDSRLLVTPASCRRVSAYNPNWDRFYSFAPPHGIASRCTGHCSTCVALDIRGMMIWRHPHLPPG